MNDLIGRTLGQYEIIELIGKGGMAAVYKARQRSIGRIVAIKVLPAHFLHEDTFLKRFQREVQTIALMQHPHILPIHDYGEENGIPYIVMTYIDGGSLGRRIEQGGPMPLDEVLNLVDQIADGLDYAHEQGVIHRDFKPGNVLIDRRDNAYLADFGIAKVSQETAQLTGSSAIGTPAYMAPEMFIQEEVTPAIDIYALGVTIYQMLGGAIPYSGTTPAQLMYAHLNQPVPDIRDIRADLPLEVQMVLERLMAKDPVVRFHRAGQAAEMLRSAAQASITGLGERSQVSGSPADEPGTHPIDAVPNDESTASDEIEAGDEAASPSWFRRNWRVITAVIVALYFYAIVIFAVLALLGA